MATVTRWKARHVRVIIQAQTVVVRPLRKVEGGEAPVQRQMMKRALIVAVTLSMRKKMKNFWL